MKTLFLVGSLFIFSGSFAQSWRFLPENDTLFFASHDPMLSNWTSEHVVEVADYTLGVRDETDSAGIHIQNLHSGWVPCKKCPGDTIGRWLLSGQHSWLGDKIRYYPDGRVSGGKPGNEWIFESEAGINDPWLWMNGDSMRLVSVGMDSIYGQPDSVRFYSSDLGDHLKLSKSSGLLEFHLHNEHGFMYHYIGSQKKKDHCYTPAFHEYYTMNMNEWICAYKGFGETYDKFISISENIMRLPIQINRYPDSIRTVYRHYHHSTTRSIMRNPPFYKSEKYAYTSTHLYLKSNYDQAASPFNALSLIGPVEIFGSHQDSDSNGIRFYLPCYISSHQSAGYYFQLADQRTDLLEIDGNPAIKIPAPGNEPEYYYSILNGRIDQTSVQGFEFSEGAGICGIYKMSDTIPDTSGYFPVGLPEMPTIAIYPNPFTTYLYVSDIAPYQSWSLLNFQGREVAIGFFESNQIEVHGLADGVYILKLHKQDGSNHFIRVSKSE
ncbi:MAG TPA: hypothetical protein DIW47_00020 [Bacteroidetes bacterium]|nr:hypothetical protein [Bacteroidota bacterium]